jgi:hypothetical protein
MLYHPTELVKSQDVIVRVGSISGTGRPVITQSGATFTVSGTPTLYTLQAATTASVAFNDGNTEFYLLGGGGFADSVIVTFSSHGFHHFLFPEGRGWYGVCS